MTKVYCLCFIHAHTNRLWAILVLNTTSVASCFFRFWVLLTSITISRKQFLYFVEIQEAERIFHHTKKSAVLSILLWDSLQVTADLLQPESAKIQWLIAESWEKTKSSVLYLSFFQRQTSALDNQLKIEIYTRGQFHSPPKIARSSSLFSLKTVLFFSKGCPLSAAALCGYGRALLCCFTLK